MQFLRVKTQIKKINMVDNFLARICIEQPNYIENALKLFNNYFNN